MCKNIHKRAKISQKMQKCANILQFFAKLRKNTTKLCKHTQNCATKIVKIQKISTAGKN